MKHHVCAIPRVTPDMPNGRSWSCRECRWQYWLHPIVRRWFRDFPAEEKD